MNAIGVHIHKPMSEKSSLSNHSAPKVSLRNSRKKKSSLFSRFTKRQKTTSVNNKQILSSMDSLDQIPLVYDTATATPTTATSLQKGGIPIMSAVDNTPPSLQSLSSSQSSDDTQSNQEKMQETVVSSNKTKSLYATGAQNLADLDAEFLETRTDRWREDGRSFADLESSAQFSMYMDVDEKDIFLKQAIQSQEKRRGKKVAFSSSLDTTSDSMPLPVLSSKQKEMVEPTVFELDSSLLSALSAINPVEESFSDDDDDEDSRESQDKSTCNEHDLDGNDNDNDNDESHDLQELDDGDIDLQEDNDTQDEEDGEEEEQAAGAFNVFSFDCMQERLSCIGCI